jgi:hypothetical protein
MYTDFVYAFNVKFLIAYCFVQLYVDTSYCALCSALMAISTAKTCSC